MSYVLQQVQYIQMDKIPNLSIYHISLNVQVLGTHWLFLIFSLCFYFQTSSYDYVCLLFARIKIPVYLNNYSYFPKIVRTVTERISQVLQKNKLILKKQTENLDETECSLKIQTVEQEKDISITQYEPEKKKTQFWER